MPIPDQPIKDPRFPVPNPVSAWRCTSRTAIRTSFRLGGLLLAIGALHSHAADGENVVTLAAMERPPYIGTALPGQGYVFELVQEAFKRSGYRVEVQYFPFARARLLAGQGYLDGIMPVLEDQRAEYTAGGPFVYSHPFPGGTLGLLKKKSLTLPQPGTHRATLAETLHALKRYRFGSLGDGDSSAALGEAEIAAEVVPEPVQNLDKLAYGHIQLALIDKYTAADLMVSRRPHLIGQLEFLKHAAQQQKFYLAFGARGSRHRQLLAAFNHGLGTLEQDGTLERIRARHGFFAPPRSTPGVTTLTVGTVNNEDMLRMRRLAAEFERQHPTILLDWRVMDENTLRLRLMSDLALADGQFDVMTIGPYETPIWARRGWIVPLTGLPRQYDIDDLLPSVRSALSYRGQPYALPFYGESSMTYYRKDLFAAAGIAMPDRPGYSDIRRFASRLHDPASGVYGICLRGLPGWGENMAYLTTLANTFGGRWFDRQWLPQLDSAPWRQAMAFYLELLGKYGPPMPSRNGFKENLALFGQGRCAIWIDATVAAGMLFDPKRSQVAASVGFAAAPTATTNRGAAWLWTWALAIPSSSPHRKAAQEFIRWATSREYVQLVGQTDGWLAIPPGTRRSTYRNAQYLKVAPFAGFVEQAILSAAASNAVHPPLPYSGIQFVEIPEFPAIAGQTGLQIAAVLEGRQSLSAALSRSQALAVKQMNDSGYYRLQALPASPASR